MRNLHFTYNLSVNEKSTLDNLNTFIKKNFGGKDGLAVPIKFDIKNAITQQDIQSIQRQLDTQYANKLSLTANLKVNKSDIQTQAQTALDQASKNLKIKVGAELDLGVIEGIAELSSMVDTITSEVSRLKQNIGSIGKDLGIDLNAQQTERQLDAMLEKSERMIKANEQSLQITARELEQTKEKLNSLKEISKEKKRAMDEEEAKFKEIAKVTSDEDKQRTARIVKLEKETEELRKQAKLEKEKAQTIKETNDKAKKAEKEQKDLTSSINEKSNEISELKEKKDLTNKVVEEAEKEKKIQQERLSFINEEIKALRERIKLQAQVENTIDKTEVKTNKPATKKEAKEVENKINEDVKKQTEEQNKSLKEQANLVEYIGRAKDKNYKHELTTKRDALYIGIQENEATKVLHDLTIQGVKDRKTIIELENKYGQELAQSRGLVEKVNELIAKGSDLTEEETDKLKEYLVQLKQELVLFDKLKGARETNERKKVYEALEKAETKNWGDDTLNKKADFQAEKAVKIGSAYVYKGILVDLINTIQNDIGVTAKADTETIKKQKELEQQREENKANRKTAQAINQEKVALESNIRYPEAGSFITDKIKNASYEQLLEKLDDLADGTLSKLMKENLGGIDYEKVETVIKNNEKKIKSLEQLIEETTDENIVKGYTQQLDKLNKNMENLKKLTNTYEEIDSMLRIMENSMSSNNSESLLGMLSEEGNVSVTKDQLKEYQQRIKDFMTWGVRGGGFTDLDNNTKSNMTWIEKDMSKLSANPDATINDWELLMDKLKGYQEQLGVTENDVASFVKKLRESSEAQREQKKAYAEQVAQGNEYEATLKRYLKLLDKESEEYKECRQALTEYTNARSQKLELGDQLLKMGEVIGRTSEVVKDAPEPISVKQTTKRKTADELINSMSETELQDIRHQNLLGNQFKLISQITDAQERFNAILKLTGMNYDDIYEKNLEIFKSISDNDKIKALKDSLNSGVEFGGELLSPNSYGKVDFSKLDLDNLNPNLDVTDLIASRRAIEEVVSSLTQLSSSIYGYGTTAESLARGVHEGLSEELTLKRAISVINDEHEKQDKQLIKLNEELHKLQSDPNANAFELKHIERKVSSTKELVDYYANAKNIAYERLIVIKDMKAHEESELANVNKVVDARKEELEVIKEATTLAKSKDAKDYARATIDSLEKIKKSPTFKNKAKNNPALASELDELRKTAEIEKGSSKGIEYWEDYINKVKDFAINQVNMKEKTLDDIINKQIMKEVALVDSSEVKSLEEINELSKQQAKSIKQAVESKEEQVERTKEVSEAKEEEISTERELVEVINEQRENEEERNKIVLKTNQEENDSLETMKERLAVLESQKAKEEEALETSSKKLEEGQKELQYINDKLDKTTELKNAEEERLNALGKTVEVAKEDVEENERKLKSTEELLRAKEEELALLKQSGESDNVYGESLANLERMGDEFEDVQKNIEEVEEEVRSLTKAYEEQTEELNKSVAEYGRLLAMSNSNDNSTPPSTQSDDSQDLKDTITLKQRDLDLELKRLVYNKELGESNQEIVNSIKEQIGLMDSEVGSFKELDKYVANIKASLKELKFEIEIEEDTRKRDEINKNTNYELLNMDELNEKLREQIDLYQKVEAKKLAVYMMRNEKDLDMDIVGNLLKQLDELSKSTQTFAEFEERIKRIGETFETLKSQTDFNKEIRKRAEASQAEAEAREKEAQAMEEYDRKLKAHIANKEREARQLIQSALNSKAMANATEEQRQALRQLGETLDLNADSIQEVNARYKEFQSTLKGIKIEATTTQLANQRSIFGKLASELKDYTMRYLDLGDAFQQVSQVFRDAFEHTKVLDEAYTNINQTMATSQKQFQTMIDQAYETGNATGQLATEVMEMMKVYASAGETAESINAKLTGTSAFQNVTGLDGTTATNSIQTIIEQFGLAKDGAMSYAEAINYLGDALVGVGYNLSKDETIAINEVVSAVEDAGSVIHQAGGSLEWYASITGTLAEQMNATGSEVGGAMRMITARTLQQKQVLEEYNDTGEDTAIAMANAEKALQSIGVTIRNSGGDLRTIEEVLGDVASKWDTLSDSSQQFVSEKLAGTNRRAYFVGIMENYQRVIELQKQAENSQGAMMKASEIQAESLSGKLNTLTNSMTLFYETILTTDTAKSFVDFGATAIDSLRAVVDFMNGKWTASISGVVASLVAFEVAKRSITAGGFIAWLKNAVKAVLGFEQGVRLATVGTVALKSALTGIAIGGLVFGLTTLINHVKETKENIENLSETITELKGNLKESENNSKLIDDYKKAVELLKQLKEGTEEQRLQQEKVNELRESLINANPSFKEILDEENASLDEQCRKMKLLNDYQLKKLVREQIQEAPKNSVVFGEGMNETASDYVGDMFGLQQALDKVDELQGKLDELESQKLSLIDSGATTKELEEVEKEIDKVVAELTERKTEAGKYFDSASDLKEQIDSFNDLLDLADELGEDKQGRTQIDTEALTKNLGGEEELLKKAMEVLGVINTVVTSVDDVIDLINGVSKEDSQIQALENLKVSLDSIEMDSDEFNEVLETMRKNFADMPEDVDTLAEAIGYLDDKIKAMSEEETALTEHIKEMFDATYVSPFAFDSVGDLDKTIDDYQKLYQANEDLINILNEANTLELKDGLPISRSFSEILNSNLDSTEEFESALLTINELFEDMSATDLTEMFGSDLASQIQEVLSIDLSNPFDELPNHAREAVEGVVGAFGDIDSQLREMFYQLNSTNEEFYTQLVENNSAVFSDLEARWGVSANEYKNVAEYKRAVDEQVYQELMRLDAKELNERYQNTLELLGIKEQAGEERVSMEDQASFLINQVDIEELRTKLENKKKELEGDKAKLEAELELEESKANNSLKLQDDTNIESLKMMQTMSNRGINHYNDFYGIMSRTGSIDGIAISATTGKATVNLASTAQNSVTAQALKNVNDEIAKINEALNSLESYEKLTSGDLTFNLDSYNPSNSSTTSSGGYSPSKDSGSSGSGSDSSEKEVEDLELEIDRYYDLQDAIDDVNNELERNQTLQEGATGTELADLMEEEIELYKKKQQAIQDLMEEQKKEKDELADTIKKYGGTFDDNGDIKDRAEWLKSLQDQVNSLSGEAKEKKKEEIELLMTIIEQYEKLHNETLPATQNEYEELNNTIKDLQREQLEYITDLQKDITSAIENELTKRYNKLKEALEKEKDLYNKQFEQEDHDKNVATYQREIDELQQQIADLARDTSLAGQLKREQLEQELADKQEEFNDYIREYEKDKGNERFDEEINKVDEELENALDPQNIADLVNKALVDGFVTIGDEVITLDTLMTDWLDETGDGLYAIGELLKSELIDNIKTAQSLLGDLGLDYTGTGNAGAKGRSVNDIDVAPSTREYQNAVSSELRRLYQSQSDIANQSVHFDSLLKVEGNVVEDVLPKVEEMLDKGINNLLNTLARQVSYR